VAERTRVLLDVAASSEEVQAVERVLRSAGIDAEVRAEWQKPPRVGNGVFWIILIVLSVALKDFLGGFSGAAGADAWKALKRLVGELRATRVPSEAPDGWVRMDDPEGTNLMLGDLPDEAYRALLELDWSQHRGGMLMWDDEAGEWFDPNRRYR
jgi:hypothetical protein